MQSITSLRASNGAVNASVVTVQAIRSSGASTIVGNTVLGLPTNFIATMGAPHTFTDPITAEVITVISEATAVDFAGYVSGSNLIIDTIAPGYVDTRGSLVGDIVVIRPTTFWSDTMANVLAQSHNDDGSLKADSITSEVPFVDAVDPVKRGSEALYDFVVPGGAVLAGLGYGSTLTASLSVGVCYINSFRQIIAAIATRTYTASKDTYVDALYNASGTATIVYTEATNNAASPALAANSILLGIVISGAANILNVGSINQGQFDKLLPIASSVPYTFTDSGGNLICPRDSARKYIGWRKIPAVGFSTSSTTQTQVTGLTCPVIVPTVGRKVEVIFSSPYLYNQNAGNEAIVGIWKGTVGSGTCIGGCRNTSGTANEGAPGNGLGYDEPATISQTYNIGMNAFGAGNASITAAAAAEPAGYIMVRLM